MPDLPCRGGGGSTQQMAQNDTHVALIILTTQMWGWGGKLLVEKLFRAKICVSAPSTPTSVLRQNKGPDTEPHFSNPPPPLLRRASMSAPPPPPPQSNFQVALFCAPPQSRTQPAAARQPLGGMADLQLTGSHPRRSPAGPDRPRGPWVLLVFRE